MERCHLFTSISEAMLVSRDQFYATFACQESSVSRDKLKRFSQRSRKTPLRSNTPLNEICLTIKQFVDTTTLIRGSSFCVFLWGRDGLRSGQVAMRNWSQISINSWSKICRKNYRSAIIRRLLDGRGLFILSGYCSEDHRFGMTTICGCNT